MSRSVRVLGSMLLGLGLAGCGNKDLGTFTDVHKYIDRFIDFNGKCPDTGCLDARERLEFRKVIPGDVADPGFEGRWSFSDPEKPVDVYVIPADKYTNRTVPPDSLPGVFWSSIQGAIEGIGTLRAKEMHLNPRPGEWWIVFYNPATPGPLTTSQFSATIDFRYFK